MIQVHVLCDPLFYTRISYHYINSLLSLMLPYYSLKMALSEIAESCSCF